MPDLQNIRCMNSGHVQLLCFKTAMTWATDTPQINHSRIREAGSVNSGCPT